MRRALVGFREAMCICMCNRRALWMRTHFYVEEWMELVQDNIKMMCLLYRSKKREKNPFLNDLIGCAIVGLERRVKGTLISGMRAWWEGCSNKLLTSERENKPRTHTHSYPLIRSYDSHTHFWILWVRQGVKNPFNLQRSLVFRMFLVIDQIMLNATRF